MTTGGGAETVMLMMSLPQSSSLAPVFSDFFSIRDPRSYELFHHPLKTNPLSCGLVKFPARLVARRTERPESWRGWQSSRIRGSLYLEASSRPPPSFFRLLSWHRNRHRNATESNLSLDFTCQAGRDSGLPLRPPGDFITPDVPGNREDGTYTHTLGMRACEKLGENEEANEE